MGPGTCTSKLQVAGHAHLSSLGLGRLMGLAAREQAVGGGGVGLTLHRHPAESQASSLWVFPGDFSQSPAGSSSSSLCVFMPVPGS